MTPAPVVRAGVREMLLSVVIPNYNYERYVGEAIESALGLDWPAVEVIVVDDGSTDGSRAVIDRYRDRIKVIHTANGGQTAACNVGFAACRGEAVLFLDSDDFLHPSLMREAATVWRPGLAKVQFQMEIVDDTGKSQGTIFPRYSSRPTPERIRRWVTASAAYPTPPGSGNVYARAVLEDIFPLEGTESASDSYLLAAAPFLGDVVTVAKPLVFYRVHGKNDGAMANFDAGKLGREVTRAEWRFRYAQEVVRRWGRSLPERALNRSMTMLAYRLASVRLAHERHPVPGDSTAKVLRDFARAFFVPQGLALVGRLTLLSWAVGVATLPRPTAEVLVRWRFASTSRPAGLRGILRAFAVGR